MGNTAPRAGIEPTSLAFWASVVAITQPRLPDITTIPIPTCLCSPLPEVSVDYYNTILGSWRAFQCPCDCIIILAINSPISLHNHCVPFCLFGFYVLATAKVISEWELGGYNISRLFVNANQIYIGRR